ncbi:MAG: tyrosine-type recombinase/integrase [Chloroflexi bacterium]|nr:tyrosine-type recombinase/integrase [Chloroflexota bacterium]
MLERFFVRPRTIDHIRSSWISEGIVQYVTWLTARSFSARTVCRRVPLLLRFGAFARERGAQQWQELPQHLDAFVASWLADHSGPRHTLASCHKIALEARTPVEQMLRLMLTDFRGRGRPHKSHPFVVVAPNFFAYLQDERGLRNSSLKLYAHYLHRFAAYLDTLNLQHLSELSPPVLSGFVIELSQRMAWGGVRNACGVLHVFLAYLYRERILSKNLGQAVEPPQVYRLAKIPRSITWEEVRRLLEAIDRRTTTGRRDYAMLLLLVTYGLRGREVAALSLDNIDWRAERLHIPERKAGHSSTYPLSPVVAQALVDYLQNGRPATNDRHIFFRTLAPQQPITAAAVSARAAHYLRRIGVSVPRPGSHTLRHTCVQRLVDAEFDLKVIGDYMGHRSSASTEVYTKVDIEALRDIARGPGEEIL